MADWTLIAIDTPLGSSDQRAELSMASNRKMKFSLVDSASLSFELPGRHWQTALVEPMTTDILAYRDDYCVQRFRVTGMDISKKDEQLTCSFTCVSYRALINAFIFHESHTRSFTSEDQTNIAWTIISESESSTNSDMALTRGLYPVTPVPRTLVGEWEADDPVEYYFAVGDKKGDAINEIALMVSGFEWDIEPERTSITTERTSLKFNTWNYDQRKQYNPRSPFVLDDGGNLSGWKRQTAPTEYANVLHGIGKYPEGAATGTDQPPQSWEPDSMNPGGTPLEGRWERSMSFPSSSQSALDDSVAAELERALAYQPSWTVDVAPGRWSGPEEMWIGDYCRLIVNDGPVEVDADARVTTINLDVDDNGMEVMNLELDRPARTYTEFRSDLEKRLLNLEHR